MKVSIVIPVYNGEKYIAECIESCLNQTYKDYEIIIINDGSTDKTIDIVASYIKKYSTKIRMGYKVNGGTASALNMGIRLMNGEWLKWVSADDILLPNALTEMMNHVNLIPNSFFYLYYTDYEIINKDSKFVEMFHDKEYSYEYQGCYMLNQFFGNGSTSLIHKISLDIVGDFLEGISHNEDLEYWLRWIIQNKLKMYYIPITTIRYRIHDESLTSTKDKNKNAELVKSFKKKYIPLLNNTQKDFYNKLQTNIPIRRKILGKLPKPIRNILVTMYQRVK